MSRIRILLTIPSLEGGGAERVMATLARHLDRERFDARLALVDKRGPYLAALPDDLPVDDLGGRGPLAFIRLLRLIRRWRPAVVFSSLTFYNTLVLLLKPWMPAGVRVVARENSVPRIHVPTMPYGRLRLMLYGPAHRRADRIVCQSPEMMDEVARFGVARERLVHIPNPLDLAAIAARAGAPSPFGNGGKHLLAVGRLIPLKRYDQLIAAFSSGAPADATLHLLGEGPEQAALQRLAGRLHVTERVVFHGFVDDPYPYFAHARALVLTSRYEGFPNVALEALACGTPVITFDYPGGSPVRDGVNGWIVPDGNTDALAAKIGEVLSARPMPEKQVRDSVSHHDAVRVIGQFEALFARLAEGGA